MGRMKKVDKERMIEEMGLNPELPKVEKIKAEERDYKENRKVIEEYFRLVRGTKLVKVIRTNHGKHTKLIGIVSTKNKGISNLIAKLKSEGKIKEEIS